MATLANLVVRITGNTASLNAAVDKAKTKLGKFGKGAGKVFKSLGSAAKGGALAAGAAIAGLAIAGVKAFVSLGDQLDKMSKRTGFSVEALGQLKFAAEQSGASLETIEKAAKRMASTVFDAGLGLKSTTDSLDALGISIAELEGLSPEQQFQAFANALAGVEDASTRAALAQDVFGRAGTELLPLFTQGEQGMAALREQAEQLGVVMSGDAATAAADFADAQNELKSALSGVFLELGAKIVPELTKFIRKVIEWKPQIVAFFTGIKDAAAPFFAAFTTGVGVVFPILQKLFTFIFNNKPLLIAAIAAVGIAIALALGPAGLAVAAIIGIIAIIGVVKANWETIWAAIANFFIGIINQIIGGINTVTGIFSQLPGVADLAIGEFEEIVVRAADSTGELATAAETVPPAVESIGVAVAATGEAAATTAGQIEGLTTTTDVLADSAAQLAERIESWKAKQEELRTGVGTLGEATAGILPTLDELTASMAEQEQQASETAAGIGAWAGTLITMGKNAAKKFTTAMGLVRDQFAETRAASERETAAINKSWEKFIVKQDATVQAMSEGGVKFADVVEGMAIDTGVSTVEMAQQMATMGVAFGDTMALIEAVGREKVDSVVSELAKVGVGAAEALRAIESLSIGEAALATGASMEALEAALGGGDVRGGRLRNLETTLGNLESLGTGQTDSQGRDMAWWIAHWQQQIDQIRDPHNFRSSEEKGNLLRILERNIQDRLLAMAEPPPMVIDESSEAVADAVEVAEKAAEELERLAKGIADEQQREVERINRTWDGFILKQDETIKRMDRVGVDFGDIVKAMAVANGISIHEMAAQMQDLGIEYGDTMGLIEHFTRDAVDNAIGHIERLRASLKMIADARNINLRPTESLEFFAGGNGRTAVSPFQGGRGPELEHRPRPDLPPNLNLGPGNRGEEGITINFNGPIYSVDDFDEAVNKARLRFRRAGN